MAAKAFSTRFAPFRCPPEQGGDDPGRLLAGLQGRKLPPVHLWNPARQADIDMRIGRDGTWYYLGSPIARKPMVQLFSTVLRHDPDGRFYLVTPAEKLGIIVEDAPFVAVELRVEGERRAQHLSFRTNVEDWVPADARHPIRVAEDAAGNPVPYILVRDRLEALIGRTVFYELVELAVSEMVDGVVRFGVWSGGVFFPLGAAGQEPE